MSIYPAYVPNVMKKNNATAACAVLPVVAEALYLAGSALIAVRMDATSVTRCSRTPGAPQRGRHIHLLVVPTRLLIVMIGLLGGTQTTSSPGSLG